jgi:hypothetical protein
MRDGTRGHGETQLRVDHNGLFGVNQDEVSSSKMQKLNNGRSTF